MSINYPFSTISVIEKNIFDSYEIERVSVENYVSRPLKKDMLVKPQDNYKFIGAVVGAAIGGAVGYFLAHKEFMAQFNNYIESDAFNVEQPNKYQWGAFQLYDRAWDSINISAYMGIAIGRILSGLMAIFVNAIERPFHWGRSFVLGQ